MTKEKDSLLKGGDYGESGENLHRGLGVKKL